MASCSPISLQIATFWRRLISTSPCCAEWVMKYPIRQRGKPMRWDRHYRRAVTRRTSRIFPPEPASRKQDAAKSGQTCVEQFEAAARTSSRSPLASTATSSVCTLGAKPGKAITEAPRSASTARADSDLTIFGLLTFLSSIPPLSGISDTTTKTRISSSKATCICLVHLAFLVADVSCGSMGSKTALRIDASKRGKREGEA